MNKQAIFKPVKKIVRKSNNKKPTNEVIKEPLITKEQKQVINLIEKLPYKRIPFVIHFLFDNFPITMQEISKGRGL